MNNLLRDLAKDAGLEINWRDVDGNDHVVSDESLAAILSSINLPAQSNAEILESREVLRLEVDEFVPALITAECHKPVTIKHSAGKYKLTLESGEQIEGSLKLGDMLPAIGEVGYHQLVIQDVSITIAVAPRRAFTLEDVAEGKKLWGLAVQLYALRHDGDASVGDYGALASLAKSAAYHGSDAIAISPVHAQFSSDVTRFRPYAPSNRAAYNIFHITERSTGSESGNLINWPSANATKLKALRTAYEAFHNRAGLDKFRRTCGIGLERHAVFEALQANLSEHHPAAYDWRQWPQAYRDPENPAVYRFQQDHANEVSFHAYLQYRADEEVRLAQQAARESGMKIGLISDLAVGTDSAGSHSWSRQKEILHGLEIGAPPDAINREGQSWGITAFSPRGLAASGYSAFIEMLRHAMRHAGGVRIDHVMGLARLWLIPQGFKSAEGAYLKLPVQDLMRLVTLESHRHRAVILGEDLGTLPHGFQAQLDDAGIAGLRVLWFERSGTNYSPPLEWTKTAVAMTSTHDLPTVAGWWQGEDIAWREKLNMKGDSIETRAADRVELWDSFQKSGATSDPMPADDDGAAVVNAACVHLGLASCTLALLPIEDALATVDQPNLPGTVDEHPNWRRRLAYSTEEILNLPDVAARLAALNEARSR